MSEPDDPALLAILAHVILWANGSTYETPEAAARALLKRLKHEGYRIEKLRP